MSARKNELEQVTKSSGGPATPLTRVQRVRTRCSVAGAAVSGQSFVADIASLPDDPDDEEQQATVERGGDDVDNEQATVSVSQNCWLACCKI